MSEIKKKKSKWESKHERGVVYFSHIPHGFYEKEMRSFLSQFGTVTNLKIGRSVRTGRAKGYAFVEFLYHDVAKIVAETMNNYLMFEKLVKCEIVPTAKVSRAMFRKKVDIARPPLVANRFKAKKIANSKRTEKQNERRLKHQNQSISKIQSKLLEYGIDLAFSAENELKTPTTENKTKKILKKKATTPVMEVDVSDEDICLKTPPHVKKIKSRSNSAATTPHGSNVNTPKTPKLNKAVCEKLAKKSLVEKQFSSKKSTPNRPLMKKKVK